MDKITINDEIIQYLESYQKWYHDEIMKHLNKGYSLASKELEDALKENKRLKKWIHHVFYTDMIDGSILIDSGRDAKWHKFKTENNL